MARGRKALSPAQQAGPDFVGATPADMAEQEARANAVVRAAENYGQERDLANQLLGQIQMSRAISKFTDVVSLQKLKYIKENKSYRALSGQRGIDRNGNEIADVGTFDGFCRALGTSASKVDEDLTNLQVFGEEALSQLTQAGAGYRELRQYRRLPEDSKVALIEAAKARDKGEFLDLAEEIIARHVREKESLASDLQQAKHDASFAGEQLQKERLRADLAERELRRCAPENRPLEAHLLDPFQSDIAARQGLLEKTLMAHDEAITALDSWWGKRVTAAPAYDPMEAVDMPPEVLAVAQHLHDSIERTATMVGSLQQRMALLFGDQIANARQHLLQIPGSADTNVGRRLN